MKVGQRRGRNGRRKPLEKEIFELRMEENGEFAGEYIMMIFVSGVDHVGEVLVPTYCPINSFFSFVLVTMFDFDLLSLVV